MLLEKFPVNDPSGCTIQRQRRELQLLMAELKDRERELNTMAASHHKHLLAWEQDRQRVLALEQRCARLEREDTEIFLDLIHIQPLVAIYGFNVFASKLQIMLKITNFSVKLLQLKNIFIINFPEPDFKFRVLSDQPFQNQSSSI